MGLRVSRFGLDFYGLEVLDKIQGSIDRQREREREVEIDAEIKIKIRVKRATEMKEGSMDKWVR